MKHINKIRMLLAIGIIAVAPGYAQNIEGWHMRSTVGFDLSNNTFVPISSAATEKNAPSGFIGGDLGADLSGIVMDPKFITFDTNFNYEHAANSSAGLDYASGGLGGGFDFQFLPVSHYPVEIFYQRTAADTTGSLFGSNSDTSQLRLRWTLDPPHAPHLVLQHEKNDNTVLLATSLLNTGYKESDWLAQANDRNAGWYWNIDFNKGNFNASSIGVLSLLGNTQEDYRTFDARAYRTLWDGKATLNTSVYAQHFFFTFPGPSTSLNDNFQVSSDLQVQHTRKLSSRYDYSFSRQSVENNDLTQSTTPITVVNLPTLNTQSLEAGLNYQLIEPVRLFQDVTYQHLTPISDIFESSTSFFQSASGISVMKRWRGFDFNTTYTGRFQTLGTNLSNRGNTFSNNVDSRVAWGDPKNVRLTGTYRYDKLNFVEQLGGFTQFNTYGLHAETTRLWGVRVAGGAERGRVDILNLAGDNRRNFTNYLVEIEHRRFQFNASRGLEAGAGSIFPTPLLGSFFIAQPLPIAQLIGTPLLDRTSRSTNVSLMVRPKDNLDVGAYFRREDDLLFTSNQGYRLWEIRGQYKIGKVSVEAGVGSLRSSINQFDSMSGLRINRYWFRIRRTFNFF